MHGSSLKVKLKMPQKLLHSQEITQMTKTTQTEPKTICLTKQKHNTLHSEGCINLTLDIKSTEFKFTPNMLNSGKIICFVDIM